MPATSRSGEAFRRRSSTEPPGLALEVDDHEVADRRQHLAQMIVAVEPRLDGADRSLGQPPDLLEDGLTLAQHRLGERPILLAQIAQGPLEGRKRVLALGGGALGPGHEIGLLDRLPCEGRIVRVDREGLVHLGRPLAEKASERQIALVHLLRWPRLVAGWHHAQLVQLAVQIVEREAPSIALVGDEAGGAGQGRAGPVAPAHARWCPGAAACWRSPRPR